MSLGLVDFIMSHRQLEHGDYVDADKPLCVALLANAQRLVIQTARARIVAAQVRDRAEQPERA